jgi:hypothetical protein
MTNKSTRRRSTAFIRASTESGIWSIIATYAYELARVAGPLIEAMGKSASAIDRALKRNHCEEAAVYEDVAMG